MTTTLRPKSRRAKTNAVSAADEPASIEAIESLDDIRLALMTDLSHQLRTPVTAMRLALDGLLSEVDLDTDSRRGQLADVTRRNLDRIVAIVDRQLELLGMALGHGSVSCEDTSIRGVIELVRMRLSHVVPVDIEVDCAVTARAFTDPARLASLIAGLLADGPASAGRRIDVRTNPSQCIVEVHVNFLQGDAPRTVPTPPAAATDFERRACEATVSALGGEIELQKDTDAKFARIILPLAGD